MNESPSETDEAVEANEAPYLQPLDLAGMGAEAAMLAVLQHAGRINVSDIFLMSDERFMTISFRRLGLVEKFGVVPPEIGRAMISYIKAAASMDIAEKRRPRDGRWLHRFEDQRFDVRVNTIPTLFGEDATLRLWSQNFQFLGLDKLGFLARDLNRIRAMLSSPSGLVLVSGPTGTGKTTTLYSSLMQLNNGERKINTLEDPVEYAMEGVRQSQINMKIGLDFPELLRSILRQAPDVIMVGEIRDSETAITAVRAANSGHLVLATLHAPMAAGAVQSMLVLGAKPFFLANCLLGVISQRLVRSLCQTCRIRSDISDSPHSLEDMADLLGPGEGQAIFGPGKCDACQQSGYASRSGLFEVMTMNQQLRRLIGDSAPADVLHAAAVDGGMIEFRKSAMLKVAQGETSTEEVLRTLPSEYLGLED